MKKYGKIAALIAGVVLALGFASCKADTDDGSTFYTVTFNSMGGTEVSSQSIESGKRATKPAAPAKAETTTEAFVFAGWTPPQTEEQPFQKQHLILTQRLLITLRFTLSGMYTQLSILN